MKAENNTLLSRAMALVKRLFSFKGRASRMEFVVVFLGMPMLFVMPCQVICMMTIDTGNPYHDFLWSLIPGTIWFWALFAVAARRAHDLGKSGWYSALLLVPILNFVALIYALATEGQSVDNQCAPSTSDKISQIETKEEPTIETPRQKQSLLSRLFLFKGRAKRTEYWLVPLGSYALLLPMFFMDETNETSVRVFSCYFSYAMFVIYWISLSVTARRFHDMNYSGWYALLMLVPIANLVLPFYLGFFKGKDEANQYGPSPY